MSSTVTEKEIFRVVPGHLSVSRAFGDIDAKLASLGGKWGVIVPTPDIAKVDLCDEDNKIDFIFMGCDEFTIDYPVMMLRIVSGMSQIKK